MKRCKNVECEEMVIESRNYCSLKCRNIYVNKYLRDYTKVSNTHKKKKESLEIEYLKAPKNCFTCEKALSFEERKNKYCNASCAAKTTNKLKKGIKHIFSEGALKKIAFSNRSRKGSGYEETKIFYNNCTICKKLFINDIKSKTCSSDCKNKLISLNSRNNPNCGGETNFKKFKYKDIWFDSSWEVEIAKLMDSLNIEWVRSRKIIFFWFDLDNKKRRYYPDFYLPKYDLYLDPKNKYKYEQDKFKLEQVVSLNKINLQVGEKDRIIDYIKKLN